MRNLDDKELQSRRTFFKKAIGRVLPTLLIVSSPISFFSCEHEDLINNDECSDCSISCNFSCSDKCSTSCKGAEEVSVCSSCSDSCSDGCSKSCFNSCSDSCQNSNKGEEPVFEEISAPTGQIDGVNYVDLGLSVKWAYANYNSIVDKPEYAGSSYKFCSVDGSNSQIVSTLLRAGFREGDSIYGTEFDKITTKLGKFWKTPKKEHFEELINNCDFEKFEYNGTLGVKVTSRKNGRSLFFPQKDFKYQKDIRYWSSTIAYVNGVVMSAFWFSCDYRFNVSIKSYDSEPTDLKSFRAVSDGKGEEPTGCNNSCSINCSGSLTSTTCSNCASSCSSSCKTKCDYNCAATCKLHCYGSCNDTCGGGCKYMSAGTSCSGCAITCSGRCYRNCSYACSSNCQSSCVNGSK